MNLRQKNSVRFVSKYIISRPYIGTNPTQKFIVKIINKNKEKVGKKGGKKMDTSKCC